MKQRSWQIGLVALATAVLAACGGGDAPSSSASQLTQTKASALAATAKSETSGRIEPSESGGKATGKTSIYIVRMAGDPVATYNGGIQGHSATKPGKGRKIDPTLGFERRWVVYNGYAEATRVPPSWHGWLHHTVDVAPTEESYTPREWEKPHVPNMTGSPAAYRPSGSTLASGRRPAATGDYQPWTPGS